jgi:hypothetical protein
MINTREEKEVAKAKTTPAKKVVFLEECVGVSTEDPHIIARLRGSGSRVQANLRTIVVSIFHVSIIPLLEQLVYLFPVFLCGLFGVTLRASVVYASAFLSVELRGASPCLPSVPLHVCVHYALGICTVVAVLIATPYATPLCGIVPIGLPYLQAAYGLAPITHCIITPTRLHMDESIQ